MISFCETSESFFDGFTVGIHTIYCENKNRSIFSFLVTGTDLTERFRDQFIPMLIGESMPWSSADSTIIRMPLSAEFMEDEIETGLKKLVMIFNKFMENASRAILFLKSILQVN